VTFVITVLDTAMTLTHLQEHCCI